MPSLLTTLSDTGGLQMRLALMLYKAYVLPLITYGYPVTLWSTVSSSCIDKLERFHRIGLLKSTGCLSSTASNSLDVISGCMPLRITLTEILATEYVRIMHEPDESPVKASLLPALASNCTKSPSKLMNHPYRLTCKKQ